MNHKLESRLPGEISITLDTQMTPPLWQKVKSLSPIRLFVTPWTVAYQAPLSMGFSRQQYWNGLPFPSPGDLPNPEIEPGSPALQADTLPSELPGKPQIFFKYLFNPKYLLIWIFLHFFALVLKRNI